MVKVIQRNEERAPKKWKRRCHCGNCSSTLEVDESDLTRYHGDDRYGMWDLATFVCPCCHQTNDIDVPKAVRKRLKSPGWFPPGGSCCRAKEVCPTV